MTSSETPTHERGGAPTTNITLPDAPSIQGLTFRHFTGDEDYPVLLDINTAVKIADGLEHDLHTIDTIRHTYGNTPNHDPSKDALIAEVEGKPAAFSRVWFENEINGPRIYWQALFVAPHQRGKGIERALLRWTVKRAGEIDSAREDKDGGKPALLSAEIYSTQAGVEQTLKEEGYEPVRYEFVMETPDLNHIPDVPAPAGIEIGLATPEQYHAIWEAGQEAFRDHWGATEEDDSNFDVFMKNPLQQPDMWVIATEGDQVAGSILNYINQEYNTLTSKKVGYTESISVRRPWRRRGVARAMLARSMQLHKERGMLQTALSVDTENPSGALQLYKSMGYETVGSYTIYRKPV